MRMREEVKQLTTIESPSESAISFYFRSGVPESKAHLSEAIQIKNMLKEALRSAGHGNGHALLRADLERLLAASDETSSNGLRGKAVFACGERGIWQEIALNDAIDESALHIGQRFHLGPLARFAAQEQRVLVLLLDREVTRFLVLANGALEAVRLPLADDDYEWDVRTTGAKGNSRFERAKEEDILRHFRVVAEKADELMRGESFARLLIGCREPIFAEFRGCMPESLNRKLLSYFLVDPGLATGDELLQKISSQLAEAEASEVEGLVRDIIGEAARNRLGAVGIEAVIHSLERGEIRELAMGKGFRAPVMQCGNCGHLDARGNLRCEACGNTNREVADVSDLLIARAFAGDFDIRFVEDEEFRRSGNIGALLRFRAEQNTPEKLAS